MENPGRSELSRLDPAACLAELRGRGSQHGWAFALMRMRSRFHRGHAAGRVHALAQKFCDPSKPFFVGRAANGTLFAGDFNDTYSVACNVVPERMLHELPDIARLAVKLGGCFVDVGANFGLLSASAGLGLGSSGRVIAIEADPATARRAAATVALNGLKNVEVLSVAVADRCGSVDFFRAGAFSNRGSAISSCGPGDAERISVSCLTLDTILASIPARVSLLKIDVEGYELAVLKGAEGTIRRDRPVIIFEFAPRLACHTGWSIADACAIINRFGSYRFSTIEEPGRMGISPDLVPPDLVNVVCEPV